VAQKELKKPKKITIDILRHTIKNLKGYGVSWRRK
jgi:hypothetical protein